jgi:hypothetical protein
MKKERHLNVGAVLGDSLLALTRAQRGRCGNSEMRFRLDGKSLSQNCHISQLYVWPLHHSLRKFMKTMRFYSPPIPLELRTMFRILACSAAFAALVSIGTLAALAQSVPPKPKSPAAIAAASRLLAEKNESCRQQAKQQGLSFLKRRRFIRDCRAGQ